MDTQEATPSKSKKILKIALGVFIVLAVLLGTAFFLTALKNAKQAKVQTLNTAVQATREPTEAEKLAKAQNEELDRLRAEHQTASTSSATTTLQNQAKSLNALRSQVLKQKIATTAPKITIEQQNQELEALRSAILNN